MATLPQAFDVRNRATSEEDRQRAADSRKLATSYRNQTVSCRAFSRSVASMPGYLSASFEDHVYSIAEEPRDSLDAATEAQKKTCKNMEAAQLDKLLCQRHADFVKGLKELKAAFKLRADEIKEEVATTEQAFTALTTNESDSAAQSDYGVTNTGTYKRTQADVEEAPLL